MSYYFYPNGAGSLTGDDVATKKPLLMGGTGHAWYVSGLTGTDAASPAGREREKPLKTTAQAVTNAAAGDVLVYLENSIETISTPVAVSKALTIVSEGSGPSRARLTNGQGGNMLTLSVTGTSLNNIYFPASTVAGGTRVAITAAGVVIDNCYFECGANDAGVNGTLSIANAGHSCQLTSTQFVAVAAQPTAAVSIGAVSGLFLEDLTLDGGAFGFSGPALFAGVLTAVYANQVHQLNNADVSLTAGWTGPWIPGTQSGSARIEG